MYLKNVMPRPLAIFLELHVYEIFFLLQNLACKFFVEGANLQQCSENFTYDVVQVIKILQIYNLNVFLTMVVIENVGFRCLL